jgi:O-antigen/teichoic acid export membrane protein
MRISSSVLWNAFGTGLPLLAALISVPPLLDAMGVARFGILSLAWVVVGYFSLFDLGLGRALTQLIAKKVGTGMEDQIPTIARSGMMCMAGLGGLGGGLVALLSPWLVLRQLSIPPHLQEETLQAFYLLALSIPVVIFTTGLRGILEGRHRFDVVNIIKAPFGALTYLGPLAALPFSHELPAVVATLVVGRLLSCTAYGFACLKLYPELRQKSPVHLQQLRELLSFGGWMTLSNLAGPLLLYLGRIALAVMVSAEAVAYFSTPYDIVVNVLLIPGIFIGVLFPLFTERFQHDHQSVRPLYRKWLRITMWTILPVSLAIFALAEAGLTLWLGPDFAQQSYRVMQLLMVGVFINSFGYISQGLIQAYGRPDLTAKLHIAELVAYIPYMWWLVAHHGIIGAAIAWSIRVTISTIALSLIANACLNRRIQA